MLEPDAVDEGRIPLQLHSSRKFQELLNEYTDEKWTDFEDLVQECIEFVQKYVQIKLPPVREYNSKRAKINPQNHKDQTVYERNRKRVVRLILGKTSAPCTLSHGDVIVALIQKLNTLISIWMHSRIVFQHNIPWIQRRPPLRRWRSDSGERKTAPGPDRLPTGCQSTSRHL